MFEFGGVSLTLQNLFSNPTTPLPPAPLLSRYPPPTDINRPSTSPHHPSPFPLVYTLSILHSAACLSRASPRRNQKEGDGGIKGSVCSDCVPRRNGILHKVCCNGLVARLGGRRNVLTGVSEVLFNPLVRWNSLGLDWAEPPTPTPIHPTSFSHLFCTGLCPIIIAPFHIYTKHR